VKRALWAALGVVVSTSAWAGGTVEGRVQFAGPAPARVALRTQSDSACSATLYDEAVLLGKDGRTLQNVVIRLVGPEVAPASTAAPVIIDQNQCAYRPRITAAAVGQPVLVRNSDGTLHNVHAYLSKKTLLNRAQPPGAKEVSLKLPAAGEVLQLKCDVHPWMLAHVVVVPHPYFAVTREDGGFQLTGIPAGTWKLEAWHETLGVKSVEVKVEEGKPTTVSFSYP
jgi:plastocyanin